MIQTFTPNEVLKAQSGELSAEDLEHLNASVQEVPELQAFLETAEYVQSEMPKLIFEPSEKPLQKIMAFVKGEMG